MEGENSRLAVMDGQMANQLKWLLSVDICKRTTVRGEREWLGGEGVAYFKMPSRKSPRAVRSVINHQCRTDRYGIKLRSVTA